LDEEHNLASGFFLVTLFLAAEEKVTGLKGFKTKTITTMARSVLFVFHTKKALCLNLRPANAVPIGFPVDLLMLAMKQAWGSSCLINKTFN
jgi:hypothetical protein